MLELESKNELKIDSLKDKLKLKPHIRTQYPETNLIYIITTPSHKKEGRYILGKTINLTNRLSTYNKSDEHEVIYYQSCPDEKSMSLVEQIVFKKLEHYREKVNRERFIIEKGNVELFINAIKEFIDFISKNF